MSLEYYSSIVIAMKEKFDKYFDPLPHLLGLAIVVDPRCKDTGLQTFLQLIFSDEDQYAPILATLQKLFDEYKNVVVVNRPPTHTTPTASRTGRANVWETIKSRRMSQHASASTSELQRYLDNPTVEDEENFDILDWWKQHQSQWPVLAQMARDILTVPVSTVSSESAFSAGGRVLGDNRTRLAPEMVEALMITRDHLYATDRRQDVAETERIQSDLDDISTGTPEELSNSSPDE